MHISNAFLYSGSDVHYPSIDSPKAELSKLLSASIYVNEWMSEWNIVPPVTMWSWI